MRTLFRLAMAAIFASLSFGIPSSALLAQGNVVGTTYTSPHFDYQIQWSSPWYFVYESTEDGVDRIELSDGISYADFLFDFMPVPDATFMVSMLTAPIDPSGSLTNIQPMLDSQGVAVSGGDAERAWGGITATLTFDDGSTVELANYFDVRTLPGGVLYVMSAYTPVYYFDDSVLLGWKNLADTALILPETAGPVVESTVAPEMTTPPEVTTVPAATETPGPSTLRPTDSVSDGEQAPAFAAGPWRVAARAVDQGEEIGYLGLGFIDGMRWVVVYADVTNWSTADAQLDVAGMTLVTAGGPVAPDQAATQSAATLLGLEPANGTSVLVPAGGGTRVALVYSIPTTETELILEFQGMQLPLDDAAGRQFDVTDLSTIAIPPAVQTNVMAALPISISGPIQLSVQTPEGFTTITLAGVELPPLDSTCTASDVAFDVLTDLSGTEFWLEADPAVTEPDTYYVWYEDDQGNRVLLNQTLIAEGLAIEGDLPDAARFGAWIERTEEVARANGTGLWATCTGQL